MSVRATISDSKSDFHKEFPFVIPPIYRRLADELLVELHLLSHQKNFKNNQIFSLGLKELFIKFTKGYKPADHIGELFNAICNCNGFNPVEINTMSEQLNKKAKLLTKENMNEFISQIKSNSKESNYYSRINAIGIYKLVLDLPYNKDSNDKEIKEEIKEISELLGYQFSRVDKDISMYKSNIDKMKQALEIISLNTSTNK